MEKRREDAKQAYLNEYGPQLETDMFIKIRKSYRNTYEIEEFKIIHHEAVLTRDVVYYYNQLKKTHKLINYPIESTF